MFPVRFPVSRSMSGVLLALAGLCAAGSAAAATSSFGLAVLPDTQFYSRYATTAEGNQFMTRYGNEPYAAQTNWLAQHAKAMGIPFVVHLGDVVDQQDKPAQWVVADGAMKILETAKVPYSILAGNHDVTNGCGYNGVQNDCTDAQRNLASEPYLKTFPTSRAQQQATFGGRDASGFHEYHTFEAEGQKYLVLALSWRISDAGIAWARGVIAANPSLPVILSFHDYGAIDSDGTTAKDTPFGNFIWDRLIKDNDQIFLVLSGHNHGSATKFRLNDQGHKVYEAVTDYQMAYQGGNGYMRLYEFDLTNNQIKAITFSPWVPIKPKATLNDFDRATLRETNNEFVIDMNFAERFAGFNPTFGAGRATREQPLTDAVREMILDGFEEVPPPDVVAPFDREDFPRSKATVAHWRFSGGTPNQPVAEGAVVADVVGGNPLKRGALANGAAAAGMVWSSDRHARSAADGSVCMLDNPNPNAQYFATQAGAPVNNETLMTGYTIEAIVKLDRRWTAANNAWMSVMTRGGKRSSVPGWSGSYGDSSTVQFAVSNLREIQWEVTTIPSAGRLQSKTNWSGEIMADQWEHIAFVNDPVTHDTTMYVAGAPVLRNVQNAIGIAGVPDQPWVIGAAINGASGGGFFGCFSEVRITKAALTPDQWLTARKNRVTATGTRQTIAGTDGDDQITGTVGADTLTGGGGADTFVYRSLRDGTDTITDFTPAEDHLNLHHLLVSLGYAGTDAIADGYVRVVDSSSGALVQIDTDGPAGASAWRTLIVLRGLTAQQVKAGDFIF